MALLGVAVGVRILVSLSVFGNVWCCGEATPLEVFELGYLIRNAIPNLAVFFVLAEVPFVLTLLGIRTLFGKRDLRIVPLGLWVVIFFFLYSSYYAGKFFDYLFSGSYGRYFLMIVPPYLILASVSIEDAWKYLARAPKKLKVAGVVASVLLLATLYPTVKKYPRMISTSPYENIVERGPINMHDHLEKVILPQVPKNAIIIHSLSSVALLHGYAAVYFPSFFFDPKVSKYVLAQLKKGQPVYMLQTYICQADPKKCDFFTPIADLVPVKSKLPNPYGGEFLELKLRTQKK